MRTLTNFEKGLIFFLAIAVVIGLGGFFFVYPRITRADEIKKEISALEETRDNFLSALAREATIGDEIAASYDKAKLYSSHFFPTMTTYEADAVVRAFLAEAGYRIDSLSVGAMATFMVSLPVTEIAEEPAEAAYPLFEYSQNVNDLIGALTGASNAVPNEAATEETPESSESTDSDDLTPEQLSEILATTQTVGSMSASFSLEMTKQQLRDFLDFIKNYDKCIYLSGYSVPSSADAAASTETSSYSFSLTFLCVEQIANFSFPE